MNPTPQHKDTTLDELLEYFVQRRDSGFDEIHQRYLNGEITIEEQVELSEIDWNKHVEEAKQALLNWHNKQNVHLLDKLAMLVKASQEVNQAFHGRPDCKSCNVQEQLIEIIEAERNELNKSNGDVK